MERKNDFIKIAKQVYKLSFGEDCNVELDNCDAEDENEYYLNITSKKNELGRRVLLTDNVLSYPYPTYTCFSDKELIFFTDIKMIWLKLNDLIEDNCYSKFNNDWIEQKYKEQIEYNNSF